MQMFLALECLHGDMLCDILQATTPTKVKTVNQNSLFHLASNLYRLGSLLSTHGQHSQPQSEQITLQSGLINKPKYPKVTCVCVFSSHSFWTSSSLDVPAGVTQEEGHTGFLIHLLSAVRALIFLARKGFSHSFPSSTVKSNFVY